MTINEIVEAAIALAFQSDLDPDDEGAVNSYLAKLDCLVEATADKIYVLKQVSSALDAKIVVRQRATVAMTLSNRRDARTIDRLNGQAQAMMHALKAADPSSKGKVRLPDGKSAWLHPVVNVVVEDATAIPKRFLKIVPAVPESTAVDGNLLKAELLKLNKATPQSAEPGEFKSDDVPGATLHKRFDARGVKPPRRK